MPHVVFTTGQLEVGTIKGSYVPKAGERVVLSTSQDGDTSAFRVLDVEWDLTGEEPSAVAIVEPESIPPVAMVLRAADEWVKLLERGQPLIACSEAQGLVDAVHFWRRVTALFLKHTTRNRAVPNTSEPTAQEDDPTERR